MRRTSSIVILVLVSCWSCRKQGDQIPFAPVDITINLNSPVYIDLNSIGGWMYQEGGSRGIILYQQSAGQYVAYERHCPYMPSSECARVSVNSTNILAADTCCGSVFLLTDGTVSEGPAAASLLQYQTLQTGNQLRIFN